jgi:hypothetical protein
MPLCRVFLPQNGLFVWKTSKSASNPSLSALETTVSVVGTGVSGVNGRSSGINGRSSGIETKGFARSIERKAQIKPEVFTVLTLKECGAPPPRLRFDASRVERFITQPINRGKRVNCSSRAHRKVNDEASLTAREARALPKNFNVPILKNDHQSVALTSDNLAVGALVPWW